MAVPPALLGHAAPDDAKGWEASITAFLRRHVAAAGAKGLVVGVSGGLDSAVVVALAVRAVGKANVHAIMLPAPDSHAQDAEHARLACRTFGIEPVLHDIGPIVDGLVASLGKEPEARIRGNAKARARMLLLYAEAQARGDLVCGTGNKSEILTGYFTKHGDGGVDLQPIGDLYKTQVRVLARHLGVPDAIVAKPPSAGLYPGQTDEGDMGLSYEDLDAVLRGMELNLDLPVIARKTGLSTGTVEKVERMVRRTEHKRRLPLIPKIGARTVGIDWRRSVHWDAP
ncbi:MAG: NAD+ synthase [bacterium]